MRQAMIEAELGDDVLGDDPTVQALEASLAERFGKEAGLFVASGTQGNQIAISIQTRPGEEVAVGEASHTVDWELGAMAALSGVQARTLPAPRGVIELEAARSALRQGASFRSDCRLLVVENTHNFCGGAVVPLEHMRSLYEVARERDARVHLDGARLWNAAVATGTPLEAYGAVADTISVCFSKGLGAPVGSMLLGPRDLLTEAREVRKRFGGAMRQVGVLAAPAAVAVAEFEQVLAEDHLRTQRLVRGLRELADVELLYEPIETNIVFARFLGRDAAQLVTSLAAAGVGCFATDTDTIRLVLHRDLDDTDVDRLLAALRDGLDEAA